MVFKRAWLWALPFLVAASPTYAQPTSIDELFQTWLTAVNSGDETELQTFFQDYLGRPASPLVLGIAADSCGFDVVRVETRSAQAMSVLVAEKCFPLLHRLEIALGEEGEPAITRLLLRNFALAQKGAAASTSGLAGRLAAGDEFAGSLLILDGDERAVARSWGSLDASGEQAIALDTPMFLASAGKMFTAVSILQLAEAGQIDLDAPLGRYLADYPNAEMAQVTIRQLLRHRGGTGDMGILGRDEGANRAQVRTIADIITLNGNRAPGFPPGSQFAYSNYGFLLLGAVVERVSGQTYYNYVASHIFEPAGMRNAGFPDLDHLQGVARGYTRFFGEEAALVSNADTLPWRGTPGGGGVASANDMLGFIQALRAGTLLSGHSLEMATSVADGEVYGMGFFASSGEFGSWGHGGNAAGMNVAVQYYPGLDATFICLASRDAACDRLSNSWFFRRIGLTE